MIIPYIIYISIYMVEMINGLPSGELTFCNGKSPCLMGKSTMENHNFSWENPLEMDILIAMLVYQRVTSWIYHDYPI